MRRLRLAGIFLIALAVVGPLLSYPARAQTDDYGTGNVDAYDVFAAAPSGDLTGQIQDQQDKVSQLDGMIQSERAQITAQESAADNLQNEIALLNSQVAAAQLEVQQDQAESDELQLQITQDDDKIQDLQTRLQHEKGYAAELIGQINQADQVPLYEIFLTKPSLSAFFDAFEQNKRLEGDLTQTMALVTSSTAALKAEAADRDAQRQSLEADKQKMAAQQLQYEAARDSKQSLANETQNRESEYQAVLYELQSQEQGLSNGVAQLQGQANLDVSDVVAPQTSSSLLVWPVDPSTGVLAGFHDPNYPFRNIMENAGIDIRAPLNTPVKAAASGYVVWNKVGDLYGNYLMIVHPGSLATVYAHLSKITAKPDTYVQQGDIIGYTGGDPNAPNAGLSMGPSLHFEVRDGGIPVDPTNFLPEANGSN